MERMKKLIQGEFEVKKIENNGKEVKNFLFEIRDIEYMPGHFLMLAFPEEAADKKKRRAYSISTSPTETAKTGLVGVTIKLVEGGYFTSRLFDESFVEGSKLFVEGPFGHSIFKTNDIKSVVFFAAGSGIAPVRSGMKYIYDTMPNTKVTLFFSIRTPEEFIFEKDINEMLKNPNFRGFITVTRYEGDDWKGLRGRIDRNIVLDNVRGDEDLFYICGNTPFVKSMKEILEVDLKVDKSRIMSEAWG